jgi:hypothetical protein
MLKNWLFVMVVLVTGCVHEITPEKFEVDREAINSFSAVSPIRVEVPQNAEKAYVIENLNRVMGKGATFVLDLNVLYKNAEELIKEVLMRNKVSVSENSLKFMKFRVNKIQYEQWAAGFLIGTFLDFTIETSSGYIQQYGVQDQSGYSLDRAIGGAVSNAVEKIFQDPMVLAFIETP